MQTKKAICRDDLAHQILTRALNPGHELDETRIAAHYEISRTPLREVYQSLAGEGFVVLSPNRGARVMPLDLARVRNLFRTAPMILHTTAIQSAEQEWLSDQSANALIVDLRDHVETQNSLDAAVSAYHFLAHLGQMARNPYVQPGLSRLLIDTTRLSLGVFQHHTKKERKKVRKLVQLFYDLAEAVDTSRPEDATRHINAIWAALMIHMTQDLSPEPFSPDPMSHGNAGMAGNGIST